MKEILPHSLSPGAGARLHPQTSPAGGTCVAAASCGSAKGHWSVRPTGVCLWSPGRCRGRTNRHRPHAGPATAKVVRCAQGSSRDCSVRRCGALFGIKARIW